MFFGFVCVAVIIAIALVGCGGGNGGAGAKGNEVRVNALPRAETVKQNGTARYWFSVTSGKTYFVQVRDQAGNSDTFADENDGEVSNSNYRHSDWDSDGVIKITAEQSTRWYIAICDKDNAGGTSFTVRVATNDESIGAPEDIALVEINGSATSGSVGQRQVGRCYFNGQAGSRYYIQARDISGNSDTFLSSENPLLDSSSYENSDWDSDSTLQITPSRTGRYYLAIEDRNNVGGTGFVVRVAIEDDNVALAADFIELPTSGSATNGSVSYRGVSRFWFETSAGTRYLIRARDTSGNTNTYLSGSNPLVDGSGYYDGGDWDSDSDLYFTAQRTGRAYLGVVDQNNAGGSNFTISVNQN